MLRAIGAMLVLAAASGCPAASSGLVDGGVAGDGAAGDGAGDGAAGGGLTFEFTTAPVLPDIAAGVTVDEVRVWLRDVRAIGDAAPGDSRTSVAAWPLEWRADSGAEPLVFALAPPGIYSSFAARLDGTDARFELRGSVRLAGGATVPFRIENDDATGQIAVPLEGLAVESTPRTATLALSLAFLTSVDWEGGELEEGEILIESDDPRMPAISAAILGGFSLVAVR